ncbi:hypothetical protein Bca4012_071713 [Brassica carinata]
MGESPFECPIRGALNRRFQNPMRGVIPFWRKHERSEMEKKKLQQRKDRREFTRTRENKTANIIRNIQTEVLCLHYRFMMEKRKKANHEDEGGDYVLPVHSQVVKIKKEFEKIHQPEMLRVLRQITGPQHSRSPLGLGQRDRRPITAGN